MPMIEVTLGEGRSPEQLRALITSLTTATMEAIGAPKQSIRVILREVPRTHFAAGNQTLAERDSSS
jgi:4-oxalocrotonate tautomerase